MGSGPVRGWGRVSGQHGLYGARSRPSSLSDRGGHGTTGKPLFPPIMSSESRYQQLFDATPIAKLVCDAETLAIVDANRSALERYGYTRDELLAFQLTDLHPPAEREMIAAVARSHSARLANAGDWTHRTRAGTLLNVELSFSRLTFGSREVVLVVAFDIAERQRAEALFRAAVSVSPNGLIMIDRTGTIKLVNHQIEAIFGYSQDELLGRSVETLLPAHLREIHAQHRHEFLQNPVPRRMGVGRELFGLDRNGRNVPIEIGLAPTVLNGEVMVLASVIDIRARRLAEQSIKDAAARWQALMESAMDGVTLVGTDGIIIECNQRMAAVLGRSIEDVIGHHIGSFAEPGDINDSMDAFLQALTLGSGQVFGVRLLRADRSVAVVDFAVNTVQFGSERIMLSIGRDVTEQRLLEHQYRQSQKMEAIGRLAGGVAHDFNNMLTAILGYAELIIMALPRDTPVQDDLQEIQGAARRAAGLTSQLLAFSRQQVLAPVVLNLNAVVTGVRKMLERVIGEDVAIELELDPQLKNVLADRGQVEQVLMNLCVNARDAMPQGGTLTIHTENAELTEGYADQHQSVTPGSYVMVAVTDTGVGMSEEVRARVFEPFFTTKEKGKGTGLGLATSYGIVKQSGGFIWAYGEPGHGATFKFYLPAVRAAAVATPISPREEELRGTETVLVAEDDDVLRKLTSNVLRHYGYTVLTAANAAEAIRVSRAHQRPVQLLLTDLIMPGESGRSLATRLVEEQPGIKVLFMSGYTDDAVARQGVMQEGSGFLQKPFTPATLARKIREVLAGVGVSR
jgi:two-component system cell cycle sensor histidine kinase/response regulator CckA